jgi:hypothetical protein
MTTNAQTWGDSFSAAGRGKPQETRSAKPITPPFFGCQWVWSTERQAWTQEPIGR